MFDVIEVKFKQFFEKMSKCKDLEDLMKIHEEFLGEVITNSFVKSKKIMRTIFDVLFVVRKFHNYVQNMLVNLTGAKVLNNEQNNFNIRSFIYRDCRLLNWKQFIPLRR